MLTAKQNRVLGLQIVAHWSSATRRTSTYWVLIGSKNANHEGSRISRQRTRPIQRGVGYRQTLVNGEVILENDELTGTRSGVMLRNKPGA
ncbi:MAG: hypothetical protein CM15mP120_08810 [Pseudomonadota bacterium]|nr:MAG: hypothetical protein CM15mP120_08810 [Pseudomonadota bacterium]